MRQSALFHFWKLCKYEYYKVDKSGTRIFGESLFATSPSAGGSGEILTNATFEQDCHAEWGEEGGRYQKEAHYGKCETYWH